MSSKRTLSTALLLGAMSVGAGAALLVPSTASAGKDASCSDLKIGNGAKLCKEKFGGNVKDMMKAVKNASGAKNCKGCHVDTKEYKLKDNAKADYEKALKKL